MTPVIEPRLEPEEDAPIGVCHRCKEDIYSDEYEYNGVLLCEDCYAQANDIRLLAGFTYAFPKMFFDYITECVTSDYEPVIEVLKDYKQWLNDGNGNFRYDDWVVQ